MGRRRVNLADGRFLIVGYDRPMRTMFAQCYEPGDNADEAPVSAVGYHPHERFAGERTHHWKTYPAFWPEIDSALGDWNLSDDERQSVRNAIYDDPDLP